MNKYNLNQVDYFCQIIYATVTRGATIYK